MRTSVLVVKITSADAAIREYLLYMLIYIMNDLNQTVLLPEGLRHSKLAKADWDKKGP